MKAFDNEEMHCFKIHIWVNLELREKGSTFHHAAADSCPHAPCPSIWSQLSTPEFESSAGGGGGNQQNAHSGYLTTLYHHVSGQICSPGMLCPRPVNSSAGLIKGLHGFLIQKNLKAVPIGPF